MILALMGLALMGLALMDLGYSPWLRPRLHF